MSSFLEKLKKGMDIDESNLPKIKEKEKIEKQNKEEEKMKEEVERKEEEEENEEEKEEEIKTEELKIETKPKKKKTIKKSLKKAPKEEEKKNMTPKAKTKKEDQSKKKPIKKTEEKINSLNLKSESEKEKETIFVSEKNQKSLMEEEGELAVDVYQTENYIVIRSAIAGTDPKEIDVSIEGDILTIRGKREMPESNEKIEDYFHKECYWGPFSRKIILPIEIDPGRTDAQMKEGILFLKIPIVQKELKKKIEIKKL